MEKSQMKNMVVLKNLPSNLIEEAFIIVKSKKIAKKLKYGEETKEITKEVKDKSNGYIVSEAEMIISNYIKNIENKSKTNLNTKFNKRYNLLKIYSLIITIICILTFIF